MKRFQLWRPTPTMAVALTALVISTTGTAVAASAMSGDTLIKIGTLSGNRLRNHTLTGNQIDMNALGVVPAAAHAGNADNATHASTADETASLGGLPASSYTLRDCNSDTGQIKGFAEVPAGAGFSSTFTTLGISYNCSGQAVEARRIAAGIYEIKFLGSPAWIATGNANADCGGVVACTDTVSFYRVGAGDWYVSVFNADNAQKLGGESFGWADDRFDVIVP